MFRCYLVTRKYYPAKLILWLLLVLFPTLVNNTFGYVLIMYPLFLLSWLSNNKTVFYFLALFLAWIGFLAVANHFKTFVNVRQHLLEYFSRQACLHFIGNAYGSRTAQAAKAAIVSGAWGAVISAMGGVGSFLAIAEDGNTKAHRDARSDLDHFVKHPDENPGADYQKVYTDGHKNSLKSHQIASLVKEWSNDYLCSCRPLDAEDNAKSREGIVSFHRKAAADRAKKSWM
jgi:hypothetical protein